MNFDKESKSEKIYGWGRSGSWFRGWGGRRRISKYDHGYSKRYKDIRTVEQASVIKIWRGHKTETET